MRSLFWRTTFGKRLDETWQAYRTMKIREHRYALKTQRLIVQMKIMSELRQEQIEQLSHRMKAAQSLANLGALNRVANAKKQRWQTLQARALEHGTSIPSTAPSTVNAADKAAQEFKKGIQCETEQHIPMPVRASSVGQIASVVLTESVQNVKLDGRKSNEEMGIDVALGVAKQADISAEELDRLLKKIADPKSVDANAYLRNKILPRLSKDQKPCRQNGHRP